MRKTGFYLNIPALKDNPFFKRLEVNSITAQVEELMKTVQKEKERNASRTRMVSVVSHEIRSPLSTILTSVSLIEEHMKHGSGTDIYPKHLQRIKSTVKDLVQTLDDFLALETLEEGKAEIHPQEFDLQKFLEELSEKMEGALKANQHISIEFEGDKRVKQDVRTITYILHNLISNASKYSEKGKRISISATNSDGKAHISVRDQGIGIPEDARNKLFQPFFRARNACGISGTGLGLNIVKRYLTLIRGRIHFVSEVNSGSIFTIEFPSVL